MFPIVQYYLWTRGRYKIDIEFNLDPNKKYLVTGYLTLTSGRRHAHVYISEECYRSSVEICEVRTGDDFHAYVVKVLDKHTSVTISLKTKGGKHRAEGVIYEL